MKMFMVAAMVFLLLPVRSVFGWEYVIGEGDTLMISVWGEKDLSLSVKVRPDGKITLPAIGEVAAANQTPARLQAVLTSKLKGIVKNPIVTVIVTEITNNKVYIFGGGVSSGVYSLNQRTTLLQLLCQIGQQQHSPAGATGTGAASLVGAQDADLQKAYVLRRGEKVKENFYDLFINGQTSDDIIIEPNDAIFIPAYTDKNVYVMGAVNTPKAIEYREGLTVMEAILGAGGFSKFASPNDTVIYRKDGSKKEITIPVKMKRLMNDGDLNQNAKLKPGDCVVVKEGIF